MGMASAAAPLIVSLLYCAALAVHASHVVYPELQSLEATEVDKELRTGYHFQPPKNWINGMYISSLLCLLPGPSVDFLAVANHRVWSVIWFAFLVLSALLLLYLRAFVKAYI